LRHNPDVMTRLRHSELALRKLDIEGAEFEVLDNMIATDIRPRILCVEFDQPSSVGQTLRTVRRLGTTGYKLVSVDSFNLTFLRS